MSECESISGSEFPYATDYSSSDSEEEYRPGYFTIPIHPLHPLLKSEKIRIITKENESSIIQTPENVLQSI